MISRRRLLEQVSVFGTTLLIGGAACGRSGGRLATEDCSRVTTPLPLGPYYLDHSLRRSDIKEDRAGVPITYQLLVLDTNCKPIRGAVVEISHADAAGEYSPGAGRQAESERWLRGFQLTDSEGCSQFHSIFPGWYPGRITHVHIRVCKGSRAVSTNLFSPRRIEAAVYDSEFYRRKGPNRTTVEDDVELNGAFQVVSALTARASGPIPDGLVAHATLVVPAHYALPGRASAIGRFSFLPT